ncbi:MAG TPA: DMT family transporter [Terracidiphilus sp.]|nr:DMT family transporter [Terracidiphilus sp.]
MPERGQVASVDGNRYGLNGAMSAKEKRRIRDAVPVAGLLVLCLLWSLESLRTEFAPGASDGPLPPFAREALRLALLTVVAALLSLLRKAEWPRGRQIWDCVLIGLGLFVVPTLLGDLTQTTIPELARVALFSLAPVFAVAFEPYLGRLTELQSRGGLLAALGCVIGTVAVFPLAIPRTFEAAGGFFAVILSVACVAAANCWAVRLVAKSPRGTAAPIAAMAGGMAALGLGIASVLSERNVGGHPALQSELTWAAAVELPALLLLFWLMRRMSAVRMTTRFIVAPLMVNVVGLILLRPSIDLRVGLGLLLTAISAGWLLCAREEDIETGEFPLKLNQS